MKSETIEEYWIPKRECPYSKLYTIRKGEFMKPNAKGVHVLAGGCGVGHFGNIDKARAFIHNYAKKEIERKLVALGRSIAELEKSLQWLGDDSWNMGAFQVRDDRGK